MRRLYLALLALISLSSAAQKFESKTLKADTMRLYGPDYFYKLYVDDLNLVTDGPFAIVDTPAVSITSPLAGTAFTTSEPVNITSSYTPATIDSIVYFIDDQRYGPSGSIGTLSEGTVELKAVVWHRQIAAKDSITITVEDPGITSTDLYVAGGQSNSVMWPQNSVFTTLAPNIWQYRQDGIMEPVTTFPLDFDDVRIGAVAPFYRTARTVQITQDPELYSPTRRIMLMPEAIGGRAFKNGWNIGDSEPYERMITRLNALVANDTLNVENIYIFWQGGEDDANHNVWGPLFRESIARLMANVQERIEFKNIYWIFPNMSHDYFDPLNDPKGDTVMHALNTMDQYHFKTGSTDSVGPKGDPGDLIHLGDTAQEIMGTVQLIEGMKKARANVPVFADSRTVKFNLTLSNSIWWAIADQGWNNNFCTPAVTGIINDSVYNVAREYLPGVNFEILTAGNGGFGTNSSNDRPIGLSCANWHSDEGVVEDNVMKSGILKTTAGNWAARVNGYPPNTPVLVKIFTTRHDNAWGVTKNFSANGVAGQIADVVGNCDTFAEISTTTNASGQIVIEAVKGSDSHVWIQAIIIEYL